MLGERIVKAREEADMSQAALARAIGVSPAYMSYIENGKKKPTNAQLVAIGGVLNVSPSSLYDAGLSTSAELMAYLLRLESLGYGLEPYLDADGRPCLRLDDAAGHAPKSDLVIRQWAEKRADLDAGKITEEDYAAWREEQIGI